MSGKMSKSEAGRLGGIKTATKHGCVYMRELARKGAQAFHAKYFLKPLALNDFLIVDRETGIPNQKTLNGVTLSAYIEIRSEEL